MTSFAASPTALPFIRRRTMGVVAGVLVLHVGLGWLLMQMKPVVMPPPKPKPIQIKMVELVATPEQPTPPKPPEPAKPTEPPKPVEPAKPVQIERPQPQPVPPKPQPAPVLAAKPTPSPEPQPAPTAIAAPAPIDVDPPPALTPESAPSPAPAPVEKASSTPKTVTGVSYKRKSEPEYPEDSRANGEQGTVKIKILINTSGKVESATVEQSSGFRRLDQAALRAIKRSTFYPKQENGVPIAVYTVISIDFILED